MVVPTKRLVALAFVATAIALAAGYVPGVDGAWIGIDALLAAACGADAVAGRRRRVGAERRAGEIFSVGRPNAVTLVLTNEGDRAISGTVMDDPLDDATASGLPGELHLPPRGTAQLRYEITPTRRGKRRFGGVTVRYALPFGLLARQERVELPADVDVYPDVHGARTLEMLRRQGREDARLGSLRVRGGDTEFERLRPYQRGDEMKHVDWRASARREELVARQFQAESNQNVVFALDIGRGMRGEDQAGITSIDRALAAALLTADVALRGGDRAGLVTFDDKPRSFLRPTGGRSGGRKLTRAVYALDAGFAATDYRSAMVFLKTQVKARSLFVIFTNLLDPRGAKDLAAAVKSLLPRHLPLCVLMRDVEVEELAVAPPLPGADADLLVRAAAAESVAWRDGIVRTLKNAGALVLDARPDDVTPLLVKRYLEIKARRLL
ncbi:MAG: DUF58 domain-containing protein [Labilithrix sp.]|nr:DUF58 domain-containing protein [Labilithrix sp.]MCW5809673.1 DUF58 domain-containing protein [Labilithrix sp.]